MPLSASAKAQCARIIGVLGGDVGTLPIAKPAGGDWLNTNGITAWSREKACIDVVTETDEEDALAGGTVDDILVEPLGSDEFIAGSRAQARLADRSGAQSTLHRRPLLRAVAAAWAPDELTAGTTTRWIQIYAGTTHSKYDGIEINCEEITRKKRKST